MKHAPPAILALHAAGWRLNLATAGAVQEHALPPGDATEVARLLAAAGADRVMLALPAEACSVARLPRLTGDGPAATGSRAWRREQLYALEERAPIVAEEVVADFIAGPDSTLAVAALAQPLSDAVASLGDAGVRVIAIVPFAVLVLDELIASGTRCDVVLIPEGGGINLFHLNDGRPDAWHWLGSRHAADVVARAKLLRESAAAPAARSATIAGDDAALRSELERAGFATAPSDACADALALAAVQRLALARWRPLIDLRRDRLAEASFAEVRAPLALALATLVLLMLSLTAALMILAARHDAEASRLRDEQQRVYLAAFPDARDRPRDVVSRLVSQRQLLGSAPSASAVAVTAARSPSALLVLRDLFTHMPDDPATSFNRIGIDDGRVELVGQAPTHGDAAQLTDRLAGDGAFDVEPPQTTALRDGGVGFTLRATAAEGGEPR